MREDPQPMRVIDALANPTHSIEVPDGETDIAGPFTERHAGGFRVAEIQSFDDLQLLGVIPAGVVEDDVMVALRQDDQRFQAARPLGDAPQECGGRCGPDRAVATPAVSRGHFQDHLIEVLQPHFGSGLSPTDPAVMHVYRQARTYLSRASRNFLGIYNLVNITVGQDAVLEMSPAVGGVYVADTISIGDGGRLRFRGGSVHVRCTELKGPRNHIDTAVIGSPWDLNAHLLGKYVRGWNLERGGN